MSTNSEEKKIKEIWRKNQFFLRVCLGHKSKLRCFECFPSFKGLLTQIQDIYPECKAVINGNDTQWHLQTSDSDWIEDNEDWMIIQDWLQGNQSCNHKHNKNDNKNEHKNENLHLTLHFIIHSSMESASLGPHFQNPLTHLHQRPPPLPYNADKDTQAPPPLPYATSNSNGHSIAMLPNGSSSVISPPNKKRRLNEAINPSLIIMNQTKINPIPIASNPNMVMPSSPPRLEVINANPYGIVYENGHVWCDACNRWFEVHCFDCHLQGRKHKQNIDRFAFRRVLKHWQNIRTKSVDHDHPNIHELSMNSDLWYAQICLSCLTEVHYSSWHQHVNGQVHQSNFAKYPRKVLMKRQLPPGNEGSDQIPILHPDKYFAQIANYVSGSKILILGEQDFSYSLAICNILKTGRNVVGTSYLGAFDEHSREPEEHPADDGVRANYFRRTLPSHSGQLQQNLHLLKTFNSEKAHSIDGTKLYECLTKAKVYVGPFDIIVFPFPRASLKRGLDFRNSTLIQGFFNEIRLNRHKLLYNHSQIQMIILENQFKEWDVANIANENGWLLKWRCSIDFACLPHYQPRELSGKAWTPKTAKLLVFLWNEQFEQSQESSLVHLNEINDLALLPDQAMKLQKQAQLMDEVHARSIQAAQQMPVRQKTIPIANAADVKQSDDRLMRLEAPPHSLAR